MLLHLPKERPERIMEIPPATPRKGCHDSSVGRASGCGLDGSEFKSRRWAKSSAPVKTGPRADSLFYAMGTAVVSGAWF